MANNELREKIDEMRLYTELVLQLPQVKENGKAGVFVRIYTRESGDLLIGESFGSFGDQGFSDQSNSSHEKARWLYLNQKAVSTTESNGKVGAGGIRGKNHIIAVSELKSPNYNSALAILLLSCFEHEPNNGSWHLLQEYAKRAGCETELQEILEQIQTLPTQSRFKKFFSWFHF